MNMYQQKQQQEKKEEEKVRGRGNNTSPHERSQLKI